jgi:hypothetical protein
MALERPDLSDARIVVRLDGHVDVRTAPAHFRDGAFNRDRLVDLEVRARVMGVCREWNYEAQ